MQTIDIASDVMILVDEGGEGIESHVLHSYRHAKQQLQRWAEKYTINVAEAYSTLHGYFTKPGDDLLAEIARTKLGIETLEERGSDRLDFYDIGVWSLRDALRAAYEAGRTAKT